jgi:hypothetical protein
MFTKSKFAVAAIAALALVAVASTGGQAEAKGFGKGLAIGLGIGAVGAIAASNAYARPVYVAPVTRCYLKDRFDHWGNYIGTVQVCRAY